MGKREVLNSVLDQIKRKYGLGSIMWLGEEQRLDIEASSSGSLALDIALGIGGIPRGRVIEIFGSESSGKTTLALHMLAEAQKRGGTAAFVDAEHALDPGYARAIGVDLDRVLLSQPSSGEEALEITESLVRSGAVDVIVIDSVAALVPEAELTGAMGDAQVGLQARLMSQAMRKLTAAISQAKTSVIFINQIRSTIAAMSWGPTTTTTGGVALKFYASLRLEIKRLGTIEENGEKVGYETLVRVVKNKLAPPFKEARFDIIYGKGIARERELLKLGETHGLIKKSGAWFAYGERQLGQGASNSALVLAQNHELTLQLENEIRLSCGMVAKQAAPAQNDLTVEPSKTKATRKTH